MEKPIRSNAVSHFMEDFRRGRQKPLAGMEKKRYNGQHGTEEPPITSDGKEYAMSYFEEMTQKARAAATTAAEKVREVADTAKISAAIIAEKRELDKSYRAIGQWYACEHAGSEVPEAIADVIAAVRASQAKIAELQARREEAESAEAVEPEEGRVCPVCGKISNTKFCPHCGAPLE